MSCLRLSFLTIFIFFSSVSSISKVLIGSSFTEETTASLSIDMAAWSTSSIDLCSAGCACSLVTPLSILKCPCQSRCIRLMNFEVLFTHYLIGIDVMFYLWGTAVNETYSVDVDNTTIETNYLLEGQCTNRAGNLTASHNLQSLSIALFNDQEIGFNSLYIWVYPCNSQLCANCSSESVCDICVLNSKIAVDGLCYCKNGFWEDTDPDSNATTLYRGCQFCNRTCATCQSNLTCETCYPNARLNELGECNCIEGFWVSTDLTCDFSTACTICHVCDNTCLGCDSSSACSTCYFGATLDIAGKCVCGEGLYLDLSKDCETKSCQLCQFCDQNCLTCAGPGSNECLSCYSLYTFVTGSCVPSSEIGLLFFIF